MIPFVTPPEIASIRARIAELQADLVAQERVHSFPNVPSVMACGIYPIRSPGFGNDCRPV